jgi:hypothetical protein
MASETVEERSSRSCGNLIADFLQATQPSVGRESGVMRWGNEEVQVEGIKAEKKGGVQG